MNQSKNHVYSSGQWSGAGQQYPSTSSFSSSSYQPTSSHDHHPPTYGTVTDIRANDPSYQGDYYSSPPFSQSANPIVSQQPTYTPGSPSNLSIRQPYRSGYPYAHAHSHSHSHSNAHTYSEVQPQSQPHYPESRPRSHSQAYVPQQAAPMMIPHQHQHSSHYATEFPESQVIVSGSPQYPATPSRPFSCDLCALSFNRQHDLKRHRETHTGEKPYLCNGGCGKTFTRKDALKRHQLVKGCGKVDDAWP